MNVHARARAIVASLGAHMPAHRRAAVLRWCVAAAATLFVVRSIGAGWRAGFPIFFPDSTSYLRVAEAGPSQWSFWFGERPIVIPMIGWVFGGNVRLIVLAQTALYVAACWWLIVVLCRIVTSRVARVASVLGIAAVAVQSRFALWNTHVLSESISISLGIAVLAAWLAFVDRPSTARLSVSWVVTALWALTRDSNALIAAVCTIPVAWAAARWWRPSMPEVRRLLRGGAVAMVVVGLYVGIAQSESGRTRYPTLNVIGQRVLIDTELTRYYQQLGMPLDDAVIGRTGRTSWDDGEAFLNDPELAELRSWVESRGRVAHLTSMVRFAPRFIDQVSADLPAQLAVDHESYDLFGVGDRLPTTIPWAIGGPRDASQLVVWAMAGALGLSAMIVGRSRRRHAVVLAASLLSVALDVYVSWLGDSVEVQRHLVTALARFGVVLVAVVVIGFDDLFGRSTSISVAEPEASGAPADAADGDAADGDAADGDAADGDAAEADAVDAGHGVTRT